MPKLTDVRKVKEIELTDYPGSKVEVYTDLRLCDVGDMDSEAIRGGDMAASMRMVPRYVKSWNFTNEEGEDLPVTEENVGLLTVTAVTELVAAFSPERPDAAEKKE